MKKMIFLLCLSSIGYLQVDAQQAATFNNQPATYIPSAENASYQNNSQFYNKDNTIDMNSTQMTGNAYYTTPGFSNPINSSPNGRVESSMDRMYNISIQGFENVNLNKPTYFNEVPKVENAPGK